MEFKELIRARYSCKAYDSGRQLLELGYPAADAKPLDNHFSRRDVGQTTSYL